MAMICQKCGGIVGDVGFHYCPNIPREDGCRPVSQMETNFVWKPLVERMVVALEKIADKLSQS